MLKFSLPIIGVSAIGIGGTGIWKLIEDPMPGWVSLAKEAEVEGSTHSNGYAKDYLKYLVSTKANKNTNLWIWKINNVVKKKGANVPDKGGFRNIAKGGLEEIKRACKQAYTSPDDKVKKGEQEANGEDEFKESDIWKYCSGGEEKIKTIKEDTTKTYDTESTYGKKYESKLISVNSESNDWFWRLKEIELIKIGEIPSESESSEFKKIKNNYRIQSGNRKVKEKCGEAYSKTESEANYPKVDVFKYCSIKGTE